MTMFRGVGELNIVKFPTTAAERPNGINALPIHVAVTRAYWEAEHPAADVRPLVPVEDTAAQDGNT